MQILPASHYSKRDKELVRAKNFKDYYATLHGKPKKKNKIQSIDDYVEDIVEHALNNGVPKFISKISDDINFRPRLFADSYLRTIRK